jgi:murein DD-endopeptidase MepM/ murein hydrolase activator NlpD
MRNNFYTFLVIPQKKRAVKKVTASSRLLQFLCVFLSATSLLLTYFAYDYLTIKHNTFEVRHLQELTEVQQQKIDELSEKIGYFAQKMADLQQTDSKIRMLAREVNKKTKIALRPAIGKNSPQALGVGGSIPDDEVGKTRLDRMNQNVDHLIEDANAQEQSFHVLMEFLKKQKSILAHMPSIWPVRGLVSSEFGFRKSPFTGRKEFHKGIDISTQLGKEIISPADGIIISSSHEPNMGNTVTINHSNGISTIYAHLLRSTVRRGQMVRRGDIVGFVGNSGRSTGPHVHYTILLNGVSVNPRTYLP